MKIDMKTATPIAALLLAACGTQSETQGDSETAPAETSSPKPDEPVSILRPDVEQPVEAEPVEPRSLRVTIGFPDGGVDLDRTAIARLETVLESRQLTQTRWPVILSGHSDTDGSDAANQRVSRARAEAVQEWLVENGVAKERIAVIALGEQNPVQPNAMPDGSPNEPGRKANRRVELAIAQTNVSPAIDIEAATPSPKAGD